MARLPRIPLFEPGISNSPPPNDNERLAHSRNRVRNRTGIYLGCPAGGGCLADAGATSRTSRSLGGATACAVPLVGAASGLVCARLRLDAVAGARGALACHKVSRAGRDGRILLLAGRRYFCARPADQSHAPVVAIL